MNRIEIGSARLRAVLTTTPGEISVQVHKTPGVGSARFAHQLSTRPRAMASGRPQEERGEYLRVSQREAQAAGKILRVLSRNGLQKGRLNGRDLAKLEQFLEQVFAQEDRHEPG